MKKPAPTTAPAPTLAQLEMSFKLAAHLEIMYVDKLTEKSTPAQYERAWALSAVTDKARTAYYNAINAAAPVAA